MKVPEVCNTNMTALPIDIVHSLVKSQTSFQAGNLKHFLLQWEALTADPTILQIVTGVINSHQHSIVKAGIDKLLAKGVIIPAAQETEEFFSTIFLRPKYVFVRRREITCPPLSHPPSRGHFGCLSLPTLAFSA